MSTLLLAYVVAYWYPDAADKTAELLATLVMMAMLGGMALVLTPFIVVPLVLRLPWLLLLTVPLGALIAGAVLSWLAVRAFVNAEV